MIVNNVDLTVRVRHPQPKISDKRINQGSGGGQSSAGDGVPVPTKLDYSKPEQDFVLMFVRSFASVV